MVHPHRAARVLLVLVLFLASALVPGIEGQTGTLCENDDRPRNHHDFVIDMTAPKLRIGSDVSALDEAGVHWLANGTGTLLFEYEVTNQGVGSSAPSGDDQLKVIVNLAEPSGSTVVKEYLTDPPAPGATANGTVQLEVTQSGRHVLQLRVNPDKVIKEECQDEAPNTDPRCRQDGLPAPCHFEYYHNNDKAYGLLADGRPDLVVSQITLDGPVRATGAPHKDSEVIIRATIQNSGTVTAYNLDKLTPGADPFKIEISVKDCTCRPAVVTLGEIPPNTSKNVEAKLAVHGLRSSIEVKVVPDSERKVAEADENNNLTQTFSIPTPDLVATAISDLRQDEGRHIIQKGKDLSFTVNVQNLGEAKAAQTDGSAFQVLVYRDSDSNKVLDENIKLDARTSVSLTVRDPAKNLTGDHTYTVVVDRSKKVFEANEDNNRHTLKIAVAVYKTQLTLTESDANPTVPPGVTARVPYTVKNGGTVTDSYRLSAPSGGGNVSFIDANGNPTTEFQLKKGDSFRGELLFEIPRDAAKEDEFETALQIASLGSGNTTTRNVTFTVGDDTVAPTISLIDPDSRYLSKDRVVVRVTDNVEVARVETDVSGSYTTLEPDQEDGSLYTIDVAGRPASFKLNIRATDSAGNEEITGFDLVRDTTPPRITDTTFTPQRGVVPGTKVSLIVEARDENMDKVVVSIQQPRPEGRFVQNLTLQAGPVNHQLRDWVVPDRPGHYTFNITAIDKAGNTVSTNERLTVQGLDVRVVPQTRPIVQPQVPEEGERVRISWTLENTSPTHGTGPFFVVLVLDDRRQIGLQTVDLGPGERRPVTFIWIAEAGFHGFTLVIDQALEVAEDNEQNNLAQDTTTTLFPDQALFAVQTNGGGGNVMAKVLDYWFLPVLFATSIVLFAIAIALGRRTPV